VSTTSSTIAGIAIPDSSLARDATTFVRDTSTQLLFDHSRRVFLWGSLVGAERGLSFDAELLYVGAMFHDIGLIEGHRSEDERFEIDGANAARRFLEQHDLPEEQVMTVWEAIALHTTSSGSGSRACRQRSATRSSKPIRAPASSRASSMPSPTGCASSPTRRSAR
jgi:HD superfamily phosphodiesterase